jgi:hypothetical protein
LHTASTGGDVWPEPELASTTSLLASRRISSLAAQSGALISQERLTLLPDGRLHYAMKKTFRDGTCELVFAPLSFIGRLVAHIPAPRFQTRVSPFS